LLFTIALTPLMFTAIGIVLVSTAAANWANAHGRPHVVVTASKIVQWPIALFFVVVSFTLLYYYGPDVEEPKWHWITPGLVIGVLCG
jgi:membrane protein